MAEANKTAAKTAARGRCNCKCWIMMLTSLILVSLPVLIGTAIVRSGHVQLVARDTGPPSSSPACATPPLDDCSFYANCLESRYHCGPSGYPIGYGQRFCQKFSNDRSLLDSKGQRWMTDTMHCLQLAVVPDAIGTATTCQALEDQAFAAHPGCYIDNGLCTLGVHDWSAILEIVNIKTVFENWDAFKATVETGVDCVEFYAFMVLRGLF